MAHGRTLRAGHKQIACNWKQAPANGWSTGAQKCHVAACTVASTWVGGPVAGMTAREAQAGMPRASAAATSWEKKLRREGKQELGRLACHSKNALQRPKTGQQGSAAPLAPATQALPCPLADQSLAKASNPRCPHFCTAGRPAASCETTS